ncbi:MAG: ankyrin repeat domain-containing protein [Puniceicoccales bacterium]|nr:ankyrin repeat domain-containing protein [Puniceicoccales bacterium]
MKNKHTQKILMGMTFLSFGSHSNVAQAFSVKQMLSEKQPSKVNESWNCLDKGKVLWRRPTQLRYVALFQQTHPDILMEEIEEAVINKNPGTVQKILLLNRTSPLAPLGNFDNSQRDKLNQLPFIAITNNDYLSFVALLTAEYRDNGEKKPLCDINYVHDGMTLIMWAIQNKATEIVNFLLTEGADLLKPCLKGTPLHIAISQNDVSLTTMIMEKLNGQHRVTNIQPQNVNPAYVCDQPTQRQQFLNQKDADNKTVFCTASEKFLEGELSISIFTNIFAYVRDYSPHNIDTGELSSNLQEIEKRLQTDAKWYRVRKNFSINEKDRKSMLQMIKDMFDHMINFI